MHGADTSRKGCRMGRRFGVMVMAGGLGLILAMPAPAPAKDRASANKVMKQGYQAAKRGYWQEAASRYERAVALEPGNAEAWSNYAVALEAIGHYEAAGDAYKRALEVDPNHRRIRKNYALFTEFQATYLTHDDGEKTDSAGEDAPEEREEQSDDAE